MMLQVDKFNNVVLLYTIIFWTFYAEVLPLTKFKHHLLYTVAWKALHPPGLPPPPPAFYQAFVNSKHPLS
jgi:hypothetical protein